MNMPRIRLLSSPETFVDRVALVGYPRPGIGLEVDIYHATDGTYMVFPHLDTEAGK